MFHAHAKTISKRLVILFSMILVCAIGIAIGGLVIIQESAGIENFIGLLMVFISVFTSFWATLGIIINVSEYNNL